VRIGEGQAQLVRARADRIPAGEPVRNRDVARQAEVMRVKGLVGLRRIEDSLGMDAGLVGERAEARDIVVEGNIHVHHLAHHHVEPAQVVQSVFALRGGPVVGVHARDEPAERRDAVALPDAQDGCVDVRRACFERGERVGNCAAGVIVPVKFDVAVRQPAQRADQPGHLRWRRDTDSVCDAQPIDHAQPVHGQVYAQ